MALSGNFFFLILKIIISNDLEKENSFTILVRDFFFFFLHKTIELTRTQRNLPIHTINIYQPTKYRSPATIEHTEIYSIHC